MHHGTVGTIYAIGSVIPIATCMEKLTTRQTSKVVSAHTYRNRKIKITTAPTKAKPRELAYLQALIQNKIDRQRVRSRESGGQTVRRLWRMMFGVETGREVGRRG